MNDHTAIERAHSPIGPSSFERAEACPASVIISRHALPQPSSFYAAEGTAAHVIFERCLNEGMDPWEFLATGVEVEGQRFEVTTEMVDALTLAVSAARVRLGSRKPEVEVRLRLEGTDMYGTSDVFRGGTLPVQVLDLKYGQGVQVTADTVQLGLYALMGLLRDNAGAILDHGEDTEVLAVATILQPRGGGEVARDHDWTRAALRDLYTRVIRVQNKLDAGEMAYGFGDHCRWCAAVTSCPLLHTMAVDAALSGVVTNTAVPVTPDMLDSAMLLVPALDLFAKRIVEAAQLYLEQGGHLQNAKLVDKRAVRDWRDEDQAIAWLDQHGIEPFEPAKLSSPAQIEKRLPAALKAALAPLVKSESTGLTLVPATDPRPARNMSAQRGQAALMQQQARAILARASKPVTPNEETKP